MSALAAGGSGTRPVPLPELRDELQFIAVNHDEHAGGGLIFDPVRQAYFRVGEEARQLLSLWSACRTVDDLCAEAGRRFGLVVDGQQLGHLLHFLDRNALTAARDPNAWQRLAEADRRSHPGWLTWAVHNYLFVKIPLLRPDPYLAWLAPRLAPLYSRAAAVTIAASGIAGLLLVSRQWDVFVGTFPHLFSLEGLALYMIALAIVKSLHELGHAVTAARYGCKVPTMGICLMVLFPMLYTDVTDAWKLEGRRKRLAISGAGLVVETALACVATLAWSFLPDGVLRSLAFAVATTGWLLSLGLNLNPFMRFDGYYILSDMTGIENLQGRAFAIGSWRLREALFGLGDAPPEPLPQRTRHWLALYAYGVWLYRLVLFIGIALVVYHLTFKVLGVVLFLIEIVFFIALPIWRELGEWWQRREAIMRTRRSLATFGVVAMLLLVVLVPWSSRIDVPAILEPHGLVQLYPVRASRVEGLMVTLGADVVAGQPLVRLSSPELDQEIVLTRLKRRLVLSRLERRGADAVDRAESHVLADTLASLDTKLAGLEAEQRELVVAAPADGRIVELDPHLAPGRWLQRRDLIAVVRGSGGVGLRGYVREDDVGRLDLARGGRFVPENLTMPARAVQLDSIAASGSATLDILELASHYSGPIAARITGRPGEGRTLTPVAGQFLVRGHVDGMSATDLTRAMRGTVTAFGQRQSYAVRVWRQVVQVLIRESGS